MITDLPRIALLALIQRAAELLPVYFSVYCLLVAMVVTVAWRLH